MDKQFLDHLMGFMEKKNQPGDDYFEFANLLHDMFEEDKSISEQTLFKFAYKSFKQKNITSEQLIKSANQYISDFEQHKVEFDNHIQQESNDTVIAKKKNNDELTAKNAENAKKIDELNKQIQMIQTESTSNSQKITQNLQEITVASQNIETKKSKFEKNTLIVINKIKGDIQKIQNYLS
jgi:chromosome segregation ATPase